MITALAILNELAKRTHTLIEDYFEFIDTQEKAYILGFLFADGYNDEKRGIIKIDLACKDEEILHKIKDRLGYSGDVKIRNRKDGTSYTSVVFCSKKMSGQLAAHGCVQGKSLIAKMPTIDPLLHQHFLRGLTDGDGCVMEKRSGSNKYLRYLFYGSEDLVTSVNDIFEDRLQIKTAGVKPHYNISRIDITGVKAVQIMEWLYEDATIYLERKFQRYKTIQGIA